jgi:hypothetical protein
LRKALSELRMQFDRWDRGEIDSFELNELVHRFHQDGARNMEGILVRHIAGLIEFYEADLSAS